MCRKIATNWHREQFSIGSDIGTRGAGGLLPAVPTLTILPLSFIILEACQSLTYEDANEPGMLGMRRANAVRKAAS